MLKDYFIKLFLVSCACIISEIICNRLQDNSGTYKAQKIVLSLCICFCVFSVFLDTQTIYDGAKAIINSVEFDENANISENNSYIVNTVDNLEMGVGENIYAKFGVMPESVEIEHKTVSGTDDKEEVEFSLCSIILPGNCKDDSLYMVKIYCESILGCKTEVYKNENY